MGKKRKRGDVLKSGYPIAEKLVARIKREVRGKVVDLKAVIAGRAAAEELQRTVVAKEGLAGFHPAHAAYVYAQNQVSVMSEQLTALDEMAPFADIVSKEYVLTQDEIVQAIRAHVNDELVLDARTCERSAGVDQQSDAREFATRLGGHCRAD